MSTLFLYTITFPNEEIEPYLISELPVLCSHFEKVHIIAAQKKQPVTSLPSNTEVTYTGDLLPSSGKAALLARHFSDIFLLLLREFRTCASKMYFLRRFRLTLSELLHSYLLAQVINKLIAKEQKAVIHYSFWMNEFPLALSHLKKQKAIDHYVFRVHGADLYRERKPYGYLPFRERCYRYSSAVFTVSRQGLDYIKKHYTYAEKARCSYLGTEDHGMNPFPELPFSIVTCSAIIPLKRLTLLAQALQSISFPLRWYHFGTGSDAEKDKVDKLLSACADNIKAEWRGHAAQHDLRHFYANTPVSLFINVSETEGLPVSIMEAISFGIPVLATKVGGTPEIVTDETGRLLPSHPDPEVLAAAIRNEYENPRTPEFRAGVKRFWKQNFSAAKNYGNFCEQLLALN